jgi:hypothetical protein
MMWMDFECETSLLAKKPETRQHFFVFSLSPWVYPIEESMASFFLFFCGLGRRTGNFRSACEISATQLAALTRSGASFFLVMAPVHFRAAETDPSGIVLSAAGADRFECAVLRWSLSHERREFHVAGDQVWRFKFSSEHQCSRVTADVADHKFDRAGERDRVFLARAPLRLRRRGISPHFGLWIRHRQSAFSIALCVKAHCSVFAIGKSDLHVPLANELWRLRQADVAHQDKNQCERNDEAQMTRLRAATAWQAK